MQRIAVVRAGALGDFLLGIPAMRALRRAYPDAHALLAGPPAPARLALALGLADEVTPFDDPALAPLLDESANLDGVPPALRSLDVAVVWMGRHETVAAQLRRLGARTIVAAPPFSRGLVATHAADWLLQTLMPLGIAPAPDWDARPWIAPPEESLLWTTRWAQERLDGAPYLVLHPSSGSARKNWPIERWAQVLRAVLSVHRLRVVLVAGPAEEERLPALLPVVSEAAAGAGSEPPVIARGPDLMHLVALLSRSSLYLGNDSGVTHLAAAVGAPTMAVFGPTNPDVWRPRGRAVHVLGGNFTAGLDGAPPIGPEPRWPAVDEVTAAALATVQLPLPLGEAAPTRSTPLRHRRQ